MTDQDFFSGRNGDPKPDTAEQQFGFTLFHEHHAASRTDWIAHRLLA
jgi:hypothetical protein